MSEDLVTVATFPNVQLAHLARQHLQASGIQSFVAEENSGGLFGDAVGWVKLQAAKDDGLRAVAVLEAEMPHEPPPSDAIMAADDALTQRDQISDTDPDELDDPEEQAEHESRRTDDIAAGGGEFGNERSRLVDRAFRAAVFGIFFFPVQFYATFLLFRAWEAEGSLNGRAQWRLLFAILINVPLVLFWVLAIATMMGARLGLQ